MPWVWIAYISECHTKEVYMRKAWLALTVIMAIGLVGLATHKAFGDPVEPDSVQLTCLRTTPSSSPVSTKTFYQGNTISLTNSVMYTGATTNTPVQDLSGCTITVVAGQPGVTNNVTAAGSAIVESNGTWTAEFTLPAYNPCYIEVTVSNVAVYTYPRYRITTQARLPSP